MAFASVCKRPFQFVIFVAFLQLLLIEKLLHYLKELLAYQSLYAILYAFMLGFLDMELTEWYNINRSIRQNGEILHAQDLRSYKSLRTLRFLMISF